MVLCREWNGEVGLVPRLKHSLWLQGFWTFLFIQIVHLGFLSPKTPDSNRLSLGDHGVWLSPDGGYGELSCKKIKCCVTGYSFLKFYLWAPGYWSITIITPHLLLSISRAQEWFSYFSVETASGKVWGMTHLPSLWFWVPDSALKKISLWDFLHEAWEDPLLYKAIQGHGISWWATA